MYRFLVFVMLATLPAACNLPRGAAMQSEILRGSAEETRDFQLVPITRNNVAAVRSWPAPPGAGRPWRAWPTGGLRSADPIGIAAGDQIDVTVFDTEENSLLTGAGERVSNLQQLVVNADGSIFLPYSGRIKVSGLSAEAARERVQDALTPSLPSAQVLLQHRPGRRNTVEILGSVGAPGSYPLPDRGFSALSLLSVAGGASAEMRNPVMRLMRGGVGYGIPLRSLYDQPRRDLSLRGGDRLIIEEDHRQFLALGASGVQNAIPFPRDKVSALDAVTLMGGIAPSRADPKGVLVLRDYGANQVRSDGRGPDRQRVIFAVDLTTSDGLFSARNFYIADGDVVLATESPISNTRTIFSLVGQVFGVFTSAGSIGE